jgi:RNA polymerase sigma factor for flagellar operon FliA
MNSLPENERVILLLYYEEECLFREIGDRFAISESRVCQIHKQAIERLRSMMRRLDPGQVI